MGWLCVLPSQDAADRVGVKLDFKDPAAVLPALKSVGSRWTDKMADLLWLNADILPGPCMFRVHWRHHGCVALRSVRARNLAEACPVPVPPCRCFARARDVRELAKRSMAPHHLARCSLPRPGRREAQV